MHVSLFSAHARAPHGRTGAASSPPAAPSAAQAAAPLVADAAAPPQAVVSAPAPPVSPAVLHQTSSAGVLTPWIQRAGRLAMATAGAAVGAAAGAAAGVVVGGVIGGWNGFRGERARETNLLHPLESVADMGGMAAHHGVHRLVDKLGNEKAAAVAGRAAGLVAGVSSGAVIGALGLAWAGLDLGARLGSRASSFLLGDAPPLTDGNGTGKTYEQGWLDKQIPAPTGEINKSSHHWFYVNHGLEILKNDAVNDPKLQRIYDFIAADPDNLMTIQNGAWDMDTFLGGAGEGIALATFHHFAEPFMPGFKPARWQCRQAYDAAADAWKAGNRREALYYLGAAMHLPQDLALPQHAVSNVSFVGKMVGHQMMEHYMETHFDQAALNRGGSYMADVDAPEQFCDRVQTEASSQYGGAVKEAWRFVEWSRENGVNPVDAPAQGSGGAEFTLDVYRQAGERAQRITAGFIELFFRDMEKQGYPI